MTEKRKENEEIKKIEKLKAQIEKMRCCGNCQHYTELERSVYNKTVCTECLTNKNKWELKK